MLDRLLNMPLDERLVRFRSANELETYLQDIGGIAVDHIGTSREGQSILGYTLGSGIRHVSVVAGAHADEPVGPMTTQMLPALLQGHFPEFLDRFTFRVISNINPDGADRNRPWFSNPLDFRTYVANTVRELPGDDIEFGYMT